MKKLSSGDEAPVAFKSGPDHTTPATVRRIARRRVLGAAIGAGLNSVAWSPALAITSPPVRNTAFVNHLDEQSVEQRLPEEITLRTEPQSSDRRPSRGGQLKIVRPGTSVENFNPAAFAQDPQIPLSYLEALVRPDPATLLPTARLATSWEWRADGLELALSIRGGVKWHDGEPMDAGDAEFSFQVYRDDTSSAVSGLFALVEAVDAVAARELVVRFRERDANWLFNAATLPVFSRRQYGKYWDALPASNRTLSGFDWSSSLPLGTGPWRVSAWNERQVEFDRFDRHWQQAPWFDTLRITVEEGQRQRLEAWETGSSNIAWPVRSRELEQFQGVEGALFAAPAASVMFAAFNFANPAQPAGSLWTDLRVRQAASLAVNRERYGDEVFDGFIRWDAAGAVAQPWANDPTLTSPEYNPAAASVFLTEAGWIAYDGDGIREDVNGWPLRPLAILRDDSRPELAAVLARVARDLAGVGIGLTIESLSANAFNERWISRRDYDLIAYAYDQLPGFTDFDLYGSAWDIRSNPAGWNPGGYANPDADVAIDEFLAAISVERQSTALKRLQRAVDEDLFALWFGFPQDLVLLGNDIDGFQPDMAWQTARTWDLWRATDRS